MRCVSSRTSGSQRQFCCAVAIAGLLALPGCGGPKIALYPVEGVVTFNGSPLPDGTDGTVLFVPSAGGPSAMGRIGSGGKYKLETTEVGAGAVAGKHLVMIMAVKDNGAGVAQTELLPPKFGSEQSGLSAEVLAKSDGPNVVDFQLEGVVPKPRRSTAPMP